MASSEQLTTIASDTTARKTLEVSPSGRYVVTVAGVTFYDGTDEALARRYYNDCSGEGSR